MNDALRQTNLVVAAARKLQTGRTAYVTFELGTNDLCASPDPMTTPAAFQTQLQAAIAALKEGLPTGSRVLMLAVPDFHHFYDITQANAAARAQIEPPAMPSVLGNPSKVWPAESSCTGRRLLSNVNTPSMNREHVAGWYFPSPGC